MRYHIITVLHRTKNDPLLTAAEDYLQRLSHYRPCEMHIIKPSTMTKESADIMAILPKNGLFVPLDEHGKEMTSIGLSQKCSFWENTGKNDISFLIGGAFGIDPVLKQKADFLWSFGLLTLPHRLALATLCEQLYRAQTILRHEPYHHE